jgi:hypothetical protein
MKRIVNASLYLNGIFEVEVSDEGIADVRLTVEAMLSDALKHLKGVKDPNFSFEQAVPEGKPS